ncbi:unnamed protein product [Gongylonema pulchrum]|uniref:Integrase_H2C2 domain-containing protein n=1 Tax=Gongylonema pulchrum TaxID=637853 RepID=A0A183E1G6_9BILA|nr:unnamed protein product [Gongylonema pulchrum]
MCEGGGEKRRVQKEENDLDMDEPLDDSNGCGYGGFTEEAYNELVHYHQTRELPRRLEGHMKHRIDCFKRKAKRFQLIDGTDQLIYIGFKPVHSSVGQFVVKKGNVEKILFQAHLETNHGGLNATRKMVSARFYWNSITSDVEQFIKRCPRCRITRLRYVVSNNVPWRKTNKFADIYGNQILMAANVCRRALMGLQMKMGALNSKRTDDLSNDDASNDAVDGKDKAGKTEVFLPHYFRVRPTPPSNNKVHLASSVAKDLVFGFLTEELLAQVMHCHAFFFFFFAWENCSTDGSYLSTGAYLSSLILLNCWIGFS